MADPGARQRLPRSARLRSGRDITEVLRRGRRLRAGPLDVFVAPSAADRSRFGLVVPRHGRTVVARNRLKRRLREIVRCEWSPAVQPSAPVDLIVRARPDAYEHGFESLGFHLIPTLRRCCDE